jgi:hypothetical protein
MSTLTPAEVGLKKKCSGCGRTLTLDCYYVKDRTKLTQDGRRLRMSRCMRCFNKLRPHRKKQNAEQRARQRAYRKLARIVSEELWDEVLQEERRKEGLV